MFNQNLGIMLYVDKVQEEREFWQAIGFHVVPQPAVMGFETFTMKSHPDSSAVMTVYDKEFIKQVSPEVIDMKPSILFECDDIQALQAKVAQVTDTASEVAQEPFPNFHFATPSGLYFAVKEK